MKLIKWAIYATAFFAVAYLILKNPAPYNNAGSKFAAFFNRSFSAFGRVADR